jgi:hypothetical protein
MVGMEEQEKTPSKMEEIKEKLRENRLSLYISRVAPDDRNWFIEFANQKCDDYGWALGVLIQSFKEKQALANLELRTTLLEARLSALENNVPEEAPKGKSHRMLSGRVIKTKGE